jgi:hypothetical protein
MSIVAPQSRIVASPKKARSRPSQFEKYPHLVPLYKSLKASDGGPLYDVKTGNLRPMRRQSVSEICAEIRLRCSSRESA